jgi:hypothetical protein
MHRSFTPRRSRGHTLVEVSISAALLVTLMGASLSVFQTVGASADESVARLDTQSENQWAMLGLVSDLQNSSSTARDEFGNPRLLLAVGETVVPVVDVRTGSLGGFLGRLGGHEPPNHLGGLVDGLGDLTGLELGGEEEPEGEEGEEECNHGLLGGLLAGLLGHTCPEPTPAPPPPGANEDASRGAGHVGSTRWGRDRASAAAMTPALGQAAIRPRNRDLERNSVLTLQKIVGYQVGAGGGAEMQWGSPITYRVVGSKLVRRQDGQERTVASNVVGFRAELSDVGTVDLTIVSQKQAGRNGNVVYQANQISVMPRN